MKKNWRFIFRMSVIVFAVTVLSVFFGNNFATQNAQEQSEKIVFGKYEKPDAITRIIRDSLKNVSVVRVNNESERAAAESLGTVIEDYGSFVLVANDKSQNLSKSASEFQSLQTTINLPFGRFEPTVDQSEQSFRLNFQKAEAADKNYYIVQFGGIAKDEWLESLKAAGAEIVQYVPHQAFIVYGDGEAIGRIADHSKVRWIGKYASEQKISPQLNDYAARLENETAMYDVAVFSRADLAEISNVFAATINGKIKNQIKLSKNFFNILRVEIPTGELSKIAAIPDVFRIDPYTKPVIEDERSAQIVAGNYSSPTTIAGPGYNPLSQFGDDGSRVTVAVIDDGISIPGNGGFYITSNNTVDGPVRGASPGASGGHGHLNASIIAGNAPFGVPDPLGYNYGLGIAPNANIVNIPFIKAGYTGTDAQAIDDAINTAGPNGEKSHIANNSWGNGANNNTYDTYAAMYDGFVRDGSLSGGFDPITLIFSAGNCGNASSGLDCSGQKGLTRPKVAKNIITVGNSENIRPEISTGVPNSADNLDDLASSSSRGPAADGRIKPDVTAPGTVITGSRAGNGGGLDGGTIDSNHYYSSGSSHSAAQVSGAAALFTSYWKRTHPGIYPSPAMVKAAIINSAQEMNGANAGAAVPNGNEGWGRINMKYMLNTGVQMKYLDGENILSSAGESSRIEGTISDSTKPVRVSLVWTDPPAAADPALVNNLDLTVTIGGNTYKGNVFSGGRSAVGGSSDSINNVENVFLPEGIPFGTPFVIEVTAVSINADGRIGNADATDQDFALIAYNYNSCAYSLSSLSHTASVSGGNINIAVTPNDSCFGFWVTENNLSWVTVNPDSPVTGNGTVTLSVQPNTNGAARSGSVRIAGRNFVINQQGSSTVCNYALSSSNTSVGAGATSGNFTVNTSSGCNWTATSDVPWITITSGSGSGSGSVNFSVQTNSGSARTGTITAGGKQFIVTQAAAASCLYSLSASGTSFASNGGTGSVNVTSVSGCAWTAVSNVSWITITSGSSGNGNGTVNFSVAANAGANTSGTITIAGQTFTVTQSSGCTFSVNPSNQSISSAGGTENFALTASGSGCGWSSVSNNVPWLTVTGGGAGNGSATVSYTVAANNGQARTGTITVGGQTFTVSQAGVCAYSLSSTNATASTGGGTGSFNINTNAGCAWTAQSNANWITITSSASGSGSATVSYSTAANTSASARTGTITIAGQTFIITQDGVFCTYSLSSALASIPVGGGTGSVNITTNNGCEWNAQSNSAWITITTGASGAGSGRVTFSVSANGGASRTGAITIGGQTFTVNQSGTSIQRHSQFDFDGDNKTDLSIFRPSVGEWWYLRSSQVGNSAFQFGSSTDKMVPADFTGDGKTDIAFFRPQTGEWYVLRSEDNSFYSFPFGTNGDIPVPADYDGDGRADPAVFRPSINTWFIFLSTGGTIIRPFGVTGDVPVVADYDGDGRADIAIYRPSAGEWWMQRSTAGTIALQFGNSTDKPVQGDYTGDGKTDVAFYRPSSGEWFILRSEDFSYYSFPFGAAGDIPSPGDYDGDGKTDAAIFRPSNSTWFVQKSSSGTLIQGFGLTGDKPVPSAFIP